MATTKTKTNKTAPQFVWVFENRWDDRHGEQGSNVKVFATKAKADAYFAKDIKTYLENYDALTGDGNVDADTVSSLNTNDIELGADDVSLADVQKAAVKCGWLDIDMDSSGTNSTWSVCRQKVE